MLKYVKAVDIKKFQDLGTKSFETIKEAVIDLLMAAKINFVQAVSKEVATFSTLYHIDKPIVPFLLRICTSY